MTIFNPLLGGYSEDQAFMELSEMITRVIILKGVVPSDIGVWEIEIDGATLRIPADKMLTDTAFKKAFINIFNFPLTLPSKGWTRFVKALSERAEIRKAEESEHVYIAKQIFETIAQFPIETEIKYAFSGRALYDDQGKFDDGGEYLYLLNKTVNDILNSMPVKISIKNLSEVLVDLGLKSPNTHPIKYERGLKRFWGFRKDRIQEIRGE